MLLVMILTLERIFQCLIVPHSITYYRIGWPEWHGANGLFWCTSINIICNHTPKILQVCNCLGMLYTCMAWICNYIQHKTGNEGVFIFRWRPGRTSCNEEVTCSWLSEAFGSLVPCDDDVTVRPWSLPTVSMFRRRLLREQVLRPMSCEVRIISKSDF